VVGLICNFLIRPVADKYFMTDAELAHEKQLAHEKDAASAREISGATVAAGNSSMITVVLAWAAVGIPLAWGVSITLQKAWVLFK